MWFEILPAALIITVALWLPGPLIGAMNKLVLGNKHRRNQDNALDRHLYLRDVALFGHAYGTLGWESIEDDEDDEDDKACDCAVDPECSPECKNEENGNTGGGDADTPKPDKKD